MKRIYLYTTLLSILSYSAQSQEMPTVFNKSLAPKGNEYKKVIIVDGESENILAVGGGREGVLTKLNRNGDVIFNKTASGNGIVSYNDVSVDRKGALIAVGGGTIAYGSARVSKYSPEGNLIYDKSLGQNTGGYFTRVIIDSSNNYILIGTDGSKPSRARIVKFSANGDLLFDKAFGLHNVFIDAALDEDGNIVAVGGDVGDMEGRARMTKVSAAGEVIFDIALARTGSSFSRVILLSDDNILAIGGGAYGTGNPCRISKIRGEDGQIIYDKAYSSVDGRFTDVSVNEEGRVVACAEEYEQGRIVKLRSDGTEIYNNTFNGALHSLSMASNGDVVAVGEYKLSQGKLIKLRSDGSVMYDNTTPVAMRSMLLTEDGEVYATSMKGYQLLKYAPDGKQMFNKSLGSYGNAVLSTLMQNPSGEVVVAGGGVEDGGRLLKVTHGLYINDISVSEPMNGVSTATLTVSLTGFLRKNGVRSPVTVNYGTGDGTARRGEDYEEASGTLSYVPSDYVIGTPITQSIQVPILSDSYLEGKEIFNVNLSESENAFITKGKGSVTIIDQPAVVKFTGGSDGQEQGLQPLTYVAGIFKQDNSPLTNRTGSPIRLEYSFGNGSATAGSDYVATTRPAFTIENGRGEGRLEVKVKDDNNYESKESVVVVLNGAISGNESQVGFEGGANSETHTQYIIDQPAYVKILKLADRNRTLTAPSGMFKIQLVKSNGRVLANCTGSDILVQFGVDESSTAVLGKDFVILEGDQVKMEGNCDNGEADLRVATIQTREKTDDKKVVVKLVKVEGPEGAGALSIQPDDKGNKASAVIKGK